MAYQHHADMRRIIRLVEGATLRVYHGSEVESLDHLRLDLSGTGATKGRFGGKVADALYLTTSPEHAALYGNVHAFDVDVDDLLQKDAAAELESWAIEMHYDNAQQMIDDYYAGDAYKALNADQYFLDALREAKAKGLPGACVNFGDLTGKVGAKTIKMGMVIIVVDASLVSKAR